jgi:hypothetical protein
VVADLIRAVLAAVAAAVLPGYFWAAVLRPTSGLGERLAYSTAVSMASVPVITVVIARVADSGVTLWIALAAVLIVFGTGALAYRVNGPAPGSASPLLPLPAPVRDPRVLALVAGALALALVMMAVRQPPLAVLLVIAVALLAGGVLMARPKPSPEPGASSATGPGPTGNPSGPASPPGRRGKPGNHPGPSANAAGTPGGERPSLDGGRGSSGRAQPPPSDGQAVAAAGARTATAPAQAAAAQAAATPEVKPERPGPTAVQRPFGLSLPLVRDGGLAVVLALTALRAYSGVVQHDWPYIRGGDAFSHAVMAEQMLAHGQYNSYLIYPPGFSALTAVIARFAALTPLQLFPVLAPMLVVVTALGAYALATRLWGWEFGLGAAALSGLVLTGAYNGFAEGRYPDLISAFFLLTMTVAALITLYEAPSWRSGVLVAAVGATPVLYHSVATLYLVVLLAVVAVTCLPYLLYVRRRRDARVLFLSLAGVAVLSACYGAYIYNIGKVFGGNHSSTSSAVSIVLGSQSAPGPGAVLKELGPPIVWFGLLGFAALAAGLRHLARPAQVMAVLTVLGWCVIMYLGSRTAVDGFPQRFERDLGAPLSVTAAFSIGLLVRSLTVRRLSSLSGGGREARGREEHSVLAMAAAATAVLGGVMLLWQTGHAAAASDRSAGQIVTRPVAAAGQWLARHNTGGNIISTPNMNPGVTNRAVLALGGYTGLQSYQPYRVLHPRSLPTAGKAPLLDSQEVLRDPQSCQSANILVHQDVRYVVLYKFHSGANLAGFAADPSHYQRAFDNASVIIYATHRTPCS